MRTRTSMTALCAALVITVTCSAAASAQSRRGRRAKTNAVKIQSAHVILTERGYEPASIKLRRGVPARVTFMRKVSATCATEVVLPDYGIKRALPLDEAVVVEFTPEKAGEFTFSCGMGMLRGSLVVR
jgi:plastocyanin domain-containing protein